jgi:aspartate/methionine/tyrosine aminotransferase
LRLGSFHLREELGWALDLDKLNDAASERTELIAVCNPNHSAGYILTEREMDGVVAAAARVEASLLPNQAYDGAWRLTNTQTPSY